MKRTIYSILLTLSIAGAVSGQADDICREFGVMPSLDSPFAQIPYVYGRVVVKGAEVAGRLPRVAIILFDRNQTERRLTIQRSGNYCFRRSSQGGTLVIEVDGVESARRTLPTFGSPQQREDFEVQPAEQNAAAPATVSAKFSHPRNEKTVELYARAIEAEKNREVGSAIGYLKQIVAIDPNDFVAWAKLGSLHFEKNSLPEADAAFRKSLELNQAYTPAWMNVGQLRVAQKQYEAAIEIFKHAISLDPKSARTHRLLGEAYLQAKQGTLGVDALNEAIRLDPIGMAECHLLIARLFDLAGAKRNAAREYKEFLKKVPNYSDRKRLEQYIKDNPE